MIWIERKPGLLLLTITLAMARGHAALWADEIRTDKEIYEKASVRSFDGEFLVFSNSKGEVIARNLADVVAVYVDSLAELEDFNRAEKAYAQQDYPAAIAGYEKSLNRARSFWKDLIRIRHLQTCDAAGQFDKAVESYITVSQTLPDKADRFMPRNAKGAASGTVPRALLLLAEALPRIKDQSAYWQLEALRLSILEETGIDGAEQAAREVMEKLQRGGGPQSRYRLQMIAIRVEFKHGQHATALLHVNQALKEADEEYLPELLFLKGQCLQALAQSRDDLIRAGLAYMRVVVHFPKSRMCAESMFRTGEIHERIDRVPKALELYQNCRELPGANTEILGRADAAIQRLRAAK